jgi:putative ABC transport system permease protein
MFKQIRSAAAIQLGSLPERWGASLVVVIGIAGVVGVLITVLAMGQAIQRTAAATGVSDRAVVTAKGTGSEGNSVLSRAVAQAVAASPGLRRTASGEPLLTMEMLTQLRSVSRRDGLVKNVTLRGVGPLAMAVRPDIHVTSGRMFRPGLREVIVGKSLPPQFHGLGVDDHLRLQDGDWTIVGTFSTSGDGLHDSEVFGDAATLMSAYHRANYQSITVQLTSVAALTSFSTALAANPSLPVAVTRESEFFTRQGGGMGRTLIAIGSFVGAIMAIGALFSAVNTMYTAISAQAVQIATLRALGFRGGAVLTAVFLEAQLLALLGALCGIAIAWWLYNGLSLDTLSGSLGQLVYTIRITPALAALGVVWALVIGLLGGLFPAIRSARRPVAEALRAT